MIEILTNAIITSITITFLVIVMMIFIEYINIANKGKWIASLQKSPIKQVIIATFLGAIPGCAGGFMVVSLYTHGIIMLGALCSAMIASCGDEAFFMIAYGPNNYIYLIGILLIIAILSGIIINLISNKTGHCDQGYTIHSEDIDKHSPQKKDHHHNGENQKNNISKERIIIIIGLLIFIILLIYNIFAESSEFEEEQLNFLSEAKINLIFAVIAIFALVKTLFSSDHFVKEHIWQHIIKHHFTSIFIWTTGALILCALIVNDNNISNYIINHSEYNLLLIIIAALIGLIPQSGPHLIFAILATNGTIPFYILITNMISQQGHVSLPLLSHSKKSWIESKGICLGIAVLTGLIGYWIAG